MGWDWVERPIRSLFKRLEAGESLMTTSRSAFTLIELLIVVAIIGILAAIAVPNFLNAQVRAKVANTQADQRSLATAIESYRLDNNMYPPTPHTAANQRFARLAAQEAPATTALARVAADVCADCEKECRKHEKKHAECKACAEACAACLKECRKLAA